MADRLRVEVAAVSLLALMLALPAPAASAAQLAISKFTLATTGPPQEVVESDGALRFINPPEAFAQAGGHPYALTGVVEFEKELAKGSIPVPTRDPKDIVVDLPPGLLGDPQAVPRCPLTQILDKGEFCPPTTQIGFAVLHFFGGKEIVGPIVNLTPEAGQSAEFGIENESKVTYVLTGRVVHTAEGYSLAVTSNEIPMTELVSAETTFWGTPADPSHDRVRGLMCERPSETEKSTCTHLGNEASGLTPVPFLTMPAACAAGPSSATVRADSWQEPGSYVAGPSALFPAMTGCELLQFNPSIAIEPDTLVADEPVSLGVELGFPQNQSPTGSYTPEVRNSVVTLPEGLSISPGIVDGIQACAATGPEGIDMPTGVNANGEPVQPGELSTEGEERGPNGEPQLAPGHCPDASTVGEAEAETPLLSVPVKGHLYLARPACGAPGELSCTEKDALDGKLYRLYLELGGKGSLANTGVNFKVAFDTEANPATGQLTSVVSGTPQLPISKLKIRLNGGPRAPLDNPATCGPAVTTADFTPWSAPSLTTPGTPDATPSSYYKVQGCSSPTPFRPGFVAGTVTPQAGQFSQFTLNLTRQDREQFVKGIQVHTPPGLLGMLSSVTLCGEPAANAGTCSDASKIGTTRVASGAGSHPFEIEGGVFLTGPYRGSPFGLSVVVHVVAGPFNLGVKVVRARVDVDPHTSTLTVTTDETGQYAVPQIVFGVPVRLKRVTVDIDRPGFMFNPTNCSALQIGASISGSEQAVSSVSSPFAVGGCKSLAFKPKFSASTSAHTSRTRGADLHVKLSYPAGSVGNEANVAKVKVDLPKQLPSRLTTLQQACTAATFATNPAACPKASVVGIAKAKSPLLPVGLAGPVYFVSHGGEAFPSLIIVLQGEGIRVDLTGTTFISKAGITSSTFKAVPDVPVDTFELYLPQGRFSALAANGSLCKARGKLAIPTMFVAQNGLVLKQSTKLAVTGCKATKPKGARTRHGKRGAGK